MMEASIRVRRAIYLNDLVLLKRIIKNNPRVLQNPDFEDNGNTSLHLAAQLGLTDIAVSCFFFFLFPHVHFINLHPQLVFYSMLFKKNKIKILTQQSIRDT